MGTALLVLVSPNPRMVLVPSEMKISKVFEESLIPENSKFELIQILNPQ